MQIKTPILVFSAAGTIFGGSILLKDRFGGEIYRGQEKVTGKTVIVTGSNSGIGLETAFELARREARVILACRDMEKCEGVRQFIEEATYNRNVVCRKLDLASQVSIREFAERIKKEEKRVDVLINNAAVMACPKSITEEGIEYQLGVNHIGPFLLTNLLLDKLKEVNEARILNLTCSHYKKAVINFTDLNSEHIYDKKVAYGQSKLANILFTVELAKRLKGTNVTVNLVNPGLCNTLIDRHLSIAKSAISGKLMYPLVWLLLKTAKQGAQTPIRCAVSPEMKDISGKYFRVLCRLQSMADTWGSLLCCLFLYPQDDCGGGVRKAFAMNSRGKEEPLVKEGLNEAAAKRLWAISEKWARLS